MRPSSIHCNIMVRNKTTILIWLLFADLIRIAFASIVSTGNFNEDFYIAWSPSHINTSPDGRSRSVKLDQESGNDVIKSRTYINEEIFRQFLNSWP